MSPNGTEGTPSSVPFRLDLLRHGEAVAGDPDAMRPLSRAGRQAIARLAETFAREGWRPAAVWSSPLLRAQQSASILVARACPGIEIETLEILTPDTEPEQVVTELVARGVREHVMLVSHQPLVGRLVMHLTSGQGTGIPPGSLIRVEFAGLPARGAGSVALELRPEP